jgi:hypothetical protein
VYDRLHGVFDLTSPQALRLLVIDARNTSALRQFTLRDSRPAFVNVWQPINALEHLPQSLNVAAFTMPEYAEAKYHLLHLCEELKKRKISLPPNLERILFASPGIVARPLSQLQDRLYQHIRCGCQTLLEEFSSHQIQHVTGDTIFELERFIALKQYSGVGEKLDNVEVMM